MCYRLDKICLLPRQNAGVNMFRCSIKKATLLFPLLVTIVLSGLLFLIAYLPVSGVRNTFLISLPLLSFCMFWFMRRYMKRYERADEQLQRQNEYLQALHETTLGLISRLDVAGLLQAIVTRSGTLVGTEHCYVYLKNAAGTEMEMAFQSGIYNRLRHRLIRPGHGFAGRIWESGKLFNVDDYSKWEGRLPDPDRDMLRAMAGVPLKSGEEIVGVLGVSFVDEGIHLNDEQLEHLVQFGELASLALENARLNDESKRELAERIKAEENLRKLSVAVDQNPASIVITDTSGIIEYVNPHFTELTGYTFEEAVGQNSNILKTGETSNEEYRQLWETILAGGDWLGEFHNRKKNGELYWEQATIAPIRDNSGDITHLIAIKEDITERKQLEGQLRQAQKMDAVGQLAGGIAHDFNNILTAIIGYASIMQLKLPVDSPLKKNAEQIAATAERGASLTQGLLAFSRKQASSLVIVDLNEIINRVHHLLLRLISEDIHLEINLEHNGLPVLADSGQIEQVLMNMSTNARDVLTQGGSIVISTEEVTIDSDFVLARGFGTPGRYALLTFSDNGDGMEPKIVKHIFEPFYTTKELGKGTGLGLSIVYGIIKKHNGYIICHSTIGIGTIFQIYLPLLDLAPAVRQGKVQENMASVREKNSVGCSILLAEDNETTRILGREILEEFGYSVIEAIDGEDALEKFRAQSGRISLVLLDVIMPKMNGREVYDAIRSIAPDMRILFCSGYAKDVVVNQGGVESWMDFLPKPFTPKELLMKIREVLDNE
jgi:PAS domain S-box-containing protein